MAWVETINEKKYVRNKKLMRKKNNNHSMKWWIKIEEFEWNNQSSVHVSMDSSFQYDRPCQI